METSVLEGNKLTSMEREIESLKKQNALMTKELDFLRNQFNSHITLNFLTYCYALALKTSEEKAENIVIFSEMIKYSYKVSPGVPVSLRTEVDYIENFISIQRCITTNVFANFQYEGCIDNKKILPRILITFVENAFKYGQFFNADYPIEIHLLATAKDVTFRVTNKKNKPSKKIPEYTNRQSTTQMLEAFFKDKYQLKIEDAEQDYSIEVVLHI